MSERLTLENAGETLGMAFREKVDRLWKDVDLDAFESLVLSQQPASVPWQAVTDYSFEARTAIEGQHPQLIKDVFAPTVVADMGCGPDAHLVKMLRALNLNVLGVDPQVRETPFARHLIRGSLLDLREQQPVADLIICREVLEHLTVLQIRKAVTNLCALSSKYVYLTTRLSSEHDLLHVETHDDLDPTHISLLSKDLIKVLFILEGFRWRGDLAEKMDWKKYGRTFVFEKAV